MSMINPAAAYRNQQIMTASSEQLTLMLYDGAIRFLRGAITAIEANDMEKAHEMNMRTQEIVREFRQTLNMDIELSDNWDKLYEFMEYRLMEGNMKKDKAMLQDVLDLLRDMRDTWAEAMKLAKGITTEK
nr:flagellar export chaperone FliS [uncultured Anaeromusa sp.]